MMTCKDCLHFNMCYVLADNPEEAEVEGAETDCSSFADRSRYVVREKGEWEWYVEPRGYFTAYDEDFGYRCPKCKVYAREWGADDDIFEEPPLHLHFCPNCGADMRKGENG